MLVLGLWPHLLFLVTVALGVAAAGSRRLAQCRLRSGLPFRGSGCQTASCEAYITTQPTPDVNERLFTPVFVSAELATAGALRTCRRPTRWRLIVSAPVVLMAVLSVPTA